MTTELTIASSSLPRDTTHADRFDRGLGFRLGRLHRVLRDDWERDLADLGVTSAQASMLRAIAENSGVGLRELSRRLATDPMNAKRLADHLERAGLVISTSDPSHAQRRGLRATSKGTAVARDINARARAWNRRFSRRAGKAELDQLGHLLAHLERLYAIDTDPAGTRPPRRG